MPTRSFPIFSSIYRFFAGRRPLLFAATTLLVCLMGLASSRITIQEDIAAMLPDDRSRATRDFELLQLAPFTRKVVITIKGGPESDAAALTGAADRLAAALTAAGIGKVTTGPLGTGGAELLPALSRSLPGLVTRQDMTSLAAWTEPAIIRERLKASYDNLLSPEGWGAEERIMRDPLGLTALALDKMRFVNMIPNMRLVNGHFLSADGRSTMVVVDSAVPMTDSQASRVMIDTIERNAAATLPAGMSFSVVSGHRYTLANAETIKRDLVVILSLTSAAILAIYIFFLRSFSAVFVFLVPTTILIIASGGIALSNPEVFGVTLGFGGVLLGIADEYAMLVYFTCRKGGRDIATALGEVSRPVLFAACSTLASFGVMFLSSLPGQRQLAVYSMIGIVASVLLSLVVLPHLIKAAPAPDHAVPSPPRRSPRSRRLTVGIWLAVLALSAWQAGGLRFNGNLSAIGIVPPELKKAEEELGRTWGDVRGKAVLVAEGAGLEEALERNDRLFASLAPKIPAGELVSLAPVLPSRGTQSENLKLWNDFWREHGNRIEADIRREGERLGFSRAAFEPFFSGLKNNLSPTGLDELRSAGLGELVDALVLPSAGVVRILTLVPDTPEIVALVSGELPKLQGVRLVSQTQFGETLSRAIGGDFTRYMIVTSLIVALLVTLIFRKPARIALALVPVATGVLCMLGMMGVLGLEFNIFNIVATILIIGLCVDYGIFMVCKLSEGSSPTADRAVLVSGLTTLAGLGALAFARHPSMHSIGITVLLGVGAGIPAALLVVPALYRQEAE